MDLTRRKFVALGIAGLLTSCSETTRQLSVHPSPTWPNLADEPDLVGNSRIVNRKDPTAVPVVDSKSGLNGVRVISRANWNTGKAIASRMNKLGRITRITVHHEGSKAVWFSDYKSTAAHLDKIRKFHQSKNWGDIGYHYVIDRAGRVWEGREIKYAGAHVKDNNPGNVGVMVLGNFEVQRPSGAQIETLKKTLTAIMQKNRVPVTRVYTHRELGTSTCPGRYLQPEIVKMRNGRLIG